MLQSIRLLESGEHECIDGLVEGHQQVPHAVPSHKRNIPHCFRN